MADWEGPDRKIPIYGVYGLKTFLGKQIFFLDKKKKTLVFVPIW